MHERDARESGVSECRQADLWRSNVQRCVHSRVVEGEVLVKRGPLADHATAIETNDSHQVEGSSIDVEVGYLALAGHRSLQMPHRVVIVPCTFDDAGMVWGPYSAGLTRFHSDHRPHLFRIDVDGTVYRLSIDGVQQGPPVRISGYGRYSRIGLWSLYYRIQVRSFRVIVPPSSRSSSAVDAGSLETKVLTWSDPVGKLTFNAHFMMNAEYAREYHLSAAAVDQSGRLLSRSQVWGQPASVSFPLKPRGVFAVADSLTEYRTPDGSRWGLMNDVHADQATAVSGGGGTPIAIAKIGDESSGISFAARDMNGRSLVVDVLSFREGNYEGHFTTIGFTDITDSSAQRDGLLRVAQLVAGRISSNPTGTHTPRSFSR